MTFRFKARHFTEPFKYSHKLSSSREVVTRDRTAGEFKDKRGLIQQQCKPMDWGQGPSGRRHRRADDRGTLHLGDDEDSARFIIKS